MKNGLIALLFLLGSFIVLLIFRNDDIIMPNFYNKNIDSLVEFAKKNNLNYEIKEEYSDSIISQNIVSQNIKEKTKLNKDDKIIVIKSIGKDLTKEYIKLNVDESGNVPIMMYHGIVDIKNSETKYTGGNVDVDGYTRTTEAFRKDLDFYYRNGYRMIRLNDYIDGNIDVEIGKSPIILTFDDGLKNNIKVTGTDKNGNIIIDSNSAVGILEEYKKKYPDYNITATFFVNGDIFGQEEYNEQIVNWLIDNGYDVGNHTWTHANFSKITKEESIKEVGKMYKKLNEILKDRFVNIVALPFGSPYDEDHANFKYILEGTYDGLKYKTISTLRVGWEAELSPFHQDFNSKFLKRIRAYDNNGNDFDISMNFEILENTRYISDGDVDKVVIPKDRKDKIEEKYNKKYIYY